MELATLAERAAREAGALLRERFRGPASGVDTKSSRTDMVSDADRDAESLIVRRVSNARPDDAILAEEGNGREGESGLRWIVDPLDGTTNFLQGIPYWCVSIAVADADGALAGVVFAPCTDELFRAIRGAGAHLNGAPLTLATEPPPLAEALIGTGFNYHGDERRHQARTAARLLPHVRDIRRFGAAALDLAWLAAGRLDGYYETGLQPWDWAAGALLVSESGRRVRRFPAADGRPAGLVAAPEALLDPLWSHVAPR